VTWTAEVSNAISPVTYSWTGSENLSGTQSSIIKYYGTSGNKSAIVTVTSADGRTSTKACSNSINVTNNVVAKAKTTATPSTQAKVVNPKTETVSQVNTDQKPVVTLEPSSSQAAASILSLGNFPWGWVSVMVILVLFLTIIYLLFNNKKV
jgi:hypothetical protein